MRKEDFILARNLIRKTLCFLFAEAFMANGSQFTLRSEASQSQMIAGPKCLEMIGESFHVDSTDMERDANLLAELLHVPDPRSYITGDLSEVIRMLNARATVGRVALINPSIFSPLAGQELRIGIGTLSTKRRGLSVYNGQRAIMLFRKGQPIQPAGVRLLKVGNQSFSTVGLINTLLNSSTTTVNQMYSRESLGTYNRIISQMDEKERGDFDEMLMWHSFCPIGFDACGETAFAILMENLNRMDGKDHIPFTIKEHQMCDGSIVPMILDQYNSWWNLASITHNDPRTLYVWYSPIPDTIEHLFDVSKTRDFSKATWCRDFVDSDSVSTVWVQGKSIFVTDPSMPGSTPNDTLSKRIGNTHKLHYQWIYWVVTGEWVSGDQTIDHAQNCTPDFSPPWLIRSFSKKRQVENRRNYVKSTAVPWDETKLPSGVRKNFTLTKLPRNTPSGWVWEKVKTEQFGVLITSNGRTRAVLGYTGRGNSRYFKRCFIASRSGVYVRCSIDGRFISQHTIIASICEDKVDLPSNVQITVDHLNRRTWDNSVHNLEFVDNIENIRRAGRRHVTLTVDLTENQGRKYRNHQQFVREEPSIMTFTGCVMDAASDLREWLETNPLKGFQNGVPSLACILSWVNGQRCEPPSWLQVDGGVIIKKRKLTKRNSSHYKYVLDDGSVRTVVGIFALQEHLRSLGFDIPYNSISAYADNHMAKNCIRTRTNGKVVSLVSLNQ